MENSRSLISQCSLARSIRRESTAKREVDKIFVRLWFQVFLDERVRKIERVQMFPFRLFVYFFTILDCPFFRNSNDLSRIPYSTSFLPSHSSISSFDELFHRLLRVNSPQRLATSNGVVCWRWNDWCTFWRHISSPFTEGRTLERSTELFINALFIRSKPDSLWCSLYFCFDDVTADTKLRYFWGKHYNLWTDIFGLSMFTPTMSCCCCFFFIF